MSCSRWIVSPLQLICANIYLPRALLWQAFIPFNAQKLMRRMLQQSQTQLLSLLLKLWVKSKVRLAASCSDRIQVGVPVLACSSRLPDKPVSYGNEGQTDGRTACTARSERETGGDPGIYTLMKTIMGNMLICLTVVGWDKLCSFKKARCSCE